MADIDAYVAQLAADLAVEFPDTDVSIGERTGKATDRAKLAVMWTGDTEDSAEVVVAQAALFVRYWPPTAKVRDDAPGGVRDMTPLLEASTQLQAFLQTKQTAYPSTGVWFSRLIRVVPDPDPEEWGVEGEMLLVFANPAVVA